MIAYYITIEILGTELLIDEILKILGNKIKIGKIIHPNDKNKKTGEKYNFGLIRLLHPKVYILTGTVAVISPVTSFVIDGKEIEVKSQERGYALRKALTDIQYGLAEDKHGWLVEVC